MTNKNRKKKMEEQTPGEVKLKGYLDMIAPSVIQFYTDHYICGNTYRSVWALREYPTATDEQAILRHLGEKDGVTLRIYTRQVTPAEEKKIISNAANKSGRSCTIPVSLRRTKTACPPEILTKSRWYPQSVSTGIFRGYRKLSANSGARARWQGRTAASMYISMRRRTMQRHCGISPISCTARKT